MLQASLYFVAALILSKYQFLNFAANQGRFSTKFWDYAPHPFRDAPAPVFGAPVTKAIVCLKSSHQRFGGKIGLDNSRNEALGHMTWYGWI